MWTPRREIVSLWLLFAASFVLRIIASPTAGVSHEELHTPTVAALLASAPRLSLLPELQYMAFCGGCSVEALMVAPWFAVFGPERLIWKAVPLLFGLGILSSAWLLARKVAGPIAGVVCGLALVFAPTWYGANSIVAFGAHTEVMLLVLLGLLAWRWAIEHPKGATWFGLCLGAAFWFDHAAAFCWPILWVGWCLAIRKKAWRKAGLARFSLGFGLGLLPWVLTQWSLRQGGRVLDGGWLAIYGKGPWALVQDSLPHLGSRISELVGPVMWRSMFLSVLEPDQWVPGLVVTLAAVAAIGVVVLGGALHSKRDAPQTWMPLMVAGLTVSFALCYLLLAPQLDVRTPGAALSANAMRYLMPLGPLVALCLGVAAQTRTGLVLAMVAVGTAGGIRLAEISPEKWTTKGLHLSPIDSSMLADRAILGTLPDPATLTEVTFSDALATLPSPSRHAPEDARHLMLEAMGLQVLGPALEHDAKNETWERSLSTTLLRTGELGPSEREALIRGTALYLQRYGGWVQTEPTSRPTDRLRPLLGASKEIETELLCRWLLHHSGPHTVEQIQQALSDHPQSTWQKSLSWYLARKQ